MRRADCAPLAGPRRRVQLGSWEALPSRPRPREEGLDPGQEFRRLVLAYGLKHCLTPPQREAVELCLFQGHNATQAAKLLGVHPSTMSRRLNRALGRLKKLSQAGSALLGQS